MKTRVSLSQRWCPHYRVPLFEKLATLSRHEWIFQFGSHPGGGKGGLDAGTGSLRVHPVRNRWVTSRYCWQHDVRLDWPGLQVAAFELSYSILSNPLLMQRARARGLPRIGWGKGISEAGSERSLLKRWVERIHLSGCDAIIAYGQTSRDYFIRKGVPAERIFVAQNSNDTNAILRRRERSAAEGAELRRQLFGDRRVIVAGYLGRLAPEKRVDVILASFAAARPERYAAHLVIAGDGPCRSQLEAQAATLACRDRIHFVPHVPDGAEHGYFQLFDLYLSYAVGGLGAVEAMAHACPVVTAPEKRPELDLLVDGETAYLGRDLSPEAFTAVLARACAAPRDERRRIAELARTRVAAGATQEKMVESFDAAVDYVLRRR
ncbi:glycosyltransferase family 4 protein [Oleiharenicola sp. Vm1]|uniref:glycosyltransferase family 4 protein n=1 Tax=Oleiharenicola sp. Vm1 TaxID=3398393 RepID=UPI0039F526E9